MSKQMVSGVYAITPESFEFNALLDCVQAVLEAGVQWLQYRDKSATLDKALAIASLCNRFEATFVMNDRPDLLLTMGSAVHRPACHVGKDDTPVAAARTMLSEQCVIGASCYGDIERARQAIAAGADYVAFGSLFPSLTKPNAPRTPLSLLTEAKLLGKPVVGIGGITLDNLSDVIKHGADAAAVVTSLFGTKPNPTQAHTIARSMLSCFES